MKKATLWITLLLLCLTGSVLAQGNPPATPLPPPGGGPGGGNPGSAGGPNNATPLTIDESYQPVASTYSGIGSVTSGEGESLGDLSLSSKGCTNQSGFVAANSGTITSEDGKPWIVPMEVNEGEGSADMFNSCSGTGDNPTYMDDLKTVVIDPDGEVITAQIFADNYFELYINGEFVARDNIAFTPFNSSAVRFQVKYPYTVAVRMADWETHLGLGMEYDSYHIGDAGFIATFSDGTVTSADWKVQIAYIAPLDDPGCVVEDQYGNPDSSGCSKVPECSTHNPLVCRALHYGLPDDWMKPDFDDSNWRDATLYQAEQVTNQPAYVDYADVFGDAEFIWSANLNLDDYVVARYTVTAPNS